MLTLYKAAANGAYALAWPYLRWKRHKGDETWIQRAAYDVTSYLPQTSEKYLWFHASSVGETRVLERLVDAIHEQNPSQQYVVSTFTTSGLTLATTLLPKAAARFLFPLDAHFPLRRIFHAFRPEGVVIVETEIWPYFLSFCDRLAIPVVLANGRLTARSAARYARFRSGLRNAFKPYRRFLVQSHEDGQRLAQIGAPPQKIRVVGNIKHDVARRADAEYWREAVRNSLGLQPNQLLLIAASTRPGEEKQIMAALRKSGLFPDRIRVLLAPRHLERLDEVRSLLENENAEYIDFSTLSEPEPSMPAVILMDRLGLLPDLLYGADLCFVGGTLADLGGHNIMEPVTCGVPVLFGPSLDNVRDAARKILAGNFGLCVADGGELASALSDFAANKLQFSRFDDNEPSVADTTARIILKEFSR